MTLPRYSQRTAQIGRIESQRRLPSQALMLASNMALLRAKNMRASLSTLLASRAATYWANWFQCPGAGRTSPARGGRPDTNPSGPAQAVQLVQARYKDPSSGGRVSIGCPWLGWVKHRPKAGAVLAD